MSGNSFTEDKPKDCRNCYFWRNNRVGCELGKENCYYRKVEKTETSECDDCPYGRASPCIGWGMKKGLEKKKGTDTEKRW